MKDDSQPASKTRPARSWLMLLVGAVFAVLGAIMMWTAASTTFRSVPATARVIETQGGIGRTKSVHAQVEVSVPGQKAFRTEVEDALGLGSWEVGSTVNVVCINVASGSPYCAVDSLLDRWLFPVVIFLIGAGALWLSLRRRSAESSPAGRQ